MIHSHFIQELSEDEHLLLWSIASHTFGQIGLEVKHNWIQMLRPDVVCRILTKVNIKEEYIGVRDSLLSKLNNGGGF
jgi:hypothetical protein